jgi:hypothetical protein
MGDRRAESAVHNKWGLLEGWLLARPERRLEFSASSAGLRVRVVDRHEGELVVLVAIADEPSAVVWRAIAQARRTA